ncbi:MAG: hypothetical protein ACKVQB_11310 [Bacteroidia bacterium]
MAIYALFFGLIPSVLSQTKASFRWSEFQKVNKYSQAVFIFKYDNGYGVIIKSDPKFNANLYKFRLSIYDENLKFKRNSTIGINKYKERVIDIWSHKNQIYFLTQIELPLQRVAARLRIFKTTNVTDSVISHDIILLTKTHFDRNPSFHIGRKDSSVSIWYSNPPEKEDASQSITSLTYTLEMKPLDKAVIDLPKKAELCKVYRVENLESGQFLIYTKEYAVRPIEKRGFSPNYQFVFYVSNPNTTTLKYRVLKNEEAYLERGRLKWNKGILEATGLFTYKLEGPKMGLWYFKHDFNSNTLLMDTIQPFNKDIKSLPTNGFQSSLMRYSRLESFYLDYFIKLDSSRRIIVAEQFFLLPAAIGSSYTYNRFYGDIMLLYLNAQGEIYQGKRLIKAQQTYNNYGEYSSYYLERKDSVLQFFFNDHYKNRNFYRYKHLVWHRQSSLVLQEVTQNRVIKTTLALYNQVDGILQVRDMLPLSPGHYLVYANKNKKGKLGVMKLE